MAAVKLGGGKEQYKRSSRNGLGSTTEIAPGFRELVATPC